MQGGMSFLACFLLGFLTVWSILLFAICCTSERRRKRPIVLGPTSGGSNPRTHDDGTNPTNPPSPHCTAVR